MEMPGQVQEVLAEVRRILGEQLSGVYLYGSAVEGGLRRDSDLDLLILVTQPLHDATRRELIKAALTHSGGKARRPLELTVVAVDGLVPWKYPPRMEMQYGEWLREEALVGDPLGPAENPDLAVLLTQVRYRSMSLSGPPADTVLDPVPESDLRRAVVESLPALLEDLRGDERNVILTLARMWVTLETGEIVPKDVAAERLLALGEIGPRSRRVLVLAKDAYRGETTDDWTELKTDVARFVDEAVTKLSTLRV